MNVTLAPLGECEFDWSRGMWVTCPEHWVWTRAPWVLVSFPVATTLERGVKRMILSLRRR